MAMILVAGALFGMGIYLFVRAVVPSRTPLVIALARISESGTSSKTSRVQDVLEAVASFGVELPWVQRDLAVVGRSAETHAAIKVAGVLAGGAWVAISGVLLSYGGIILPAVTLVVAIIPGAVIGFLLPDFLLRDSATKRRDEFRHALGSFLDVAGICFASGSGAESALLEAAQAGDGWAHQRLRHSLVGSQNASDPPWDALERLGRELGIQELEALAASMTLAGEEGAHIRESVVAMSATLRGHLLADAEERAGSSAERMSFPVALLALSFIVFLTYPAVMVIVGTS